MRYNEKEERDLLAQIGLPGMFMALMVYMLLNVWTDVSKLKTYNVWHMFFLSGFTSLAVFTGCIFTLIAVVVCTGALYYFMRHIPYTTLGEGDGKMLMIGAMGLQLMYRFIDPMTTSIAFVCMYLTCSMVQVSVLKWMCWRKGRDLSFLQYRVSRNQMITPEALPIFVAVILYTIIGRV